MIHLSYIKFPIVSIENKHFFRVSNVRFRQYFRVLQRFLSYIVEYCLLLSFYRTKSKQIVKYLLEYKKSPPSKFQKVEILKFVAADIT